MMVFFNSLCALLAAILLGFIQVKQVHCSIGDRQLEFRSCVITCSHSLDCSIPSNMLQKSDEEHETIVDTYEEHQSQLNNDHHVPFDMRIFGWKCEDKCKYECMHLIMEQRISEDRPVVKYYGKWPFIRFLGIQEPASVIFSLMNLYAQIWSYQRITKLVPPKAEMYHTIRLSSLVAANAWVWSTIFHCRDLPWTEKMDYFAAILNLCYGFYVVFMRMMKPQWRLLRRITGHLISMYYLWHITYLTSLPRFDYTYNMIAGVVIGMVHNLIWIVWSVKMWGERDYVKYGLFSILAIMAAMMLEIFDFAPWFGVFDAHSLWHLSTVPLAITWNWFIVADTIYCHNNIVDYGKKL